jgi:hypothetical protein
VLLMLAPYPLVFRSAGSSSVSHASRSGCLPFDKDNQEGADDTEPSDGRKHVPPFDAGSRASALGWASWL